MDTDPVFKLIFHIVEVKQVFGFLSFKTLKLLTEAA